MLRYLIFGLIIPFLSACKVKEKLSQSQPITHEIWDSLLQTHVTEDGWVDYVGFQRDSHQLKRYLNILSVGHPNRANWTREERLAYWINAYNAFTIDLVSRHFPVASIKDIKKGIPFVNTVWDIKFIQIEDRTYDLNNIEHGIIRKYFQEARIHFAVNCASVSCPKLLNRAYTAANLEAQLDNAARTFINDSNRNVVEPDRVALSKIFTWFKGDFTTNKKGLRDFINQYSTQPLSPDIKISFLDYDWGINDLRNIKK